MRFRLLATLSVMLWAGTALAGEEKGYARPHLLMEPARLAKPAAARQYVILDAGGQDRYAEAHIPGALWVDHGEWKEAFGDGRDAKAWSERIGKLGIGPDSKVVVYDDLGQKNAGRIWWLLRYWGVNHVRLLNGGWKAWTAAGYDNADEATPAPKPAKFKAEPRRRRLATMRQLIGLIGSDELQIVDARTEGEYCGVDKKGNARAGHMPGAKNLDWARMIDPETDRFKPADQLRKLFDSAGIDLGRPTATHCQSGGRASVMVFGMELLGSKSVRNYYQSWNEWGNAEDTPIVVPEKPKEEKQKE